MGQGRERAVQFLRDHPEMTLQLDAELRRRMFPERFASENENEQAEPEAAQS
ncbi:MAG: hypothetical protein ACPG7R_08975 [Planctomycetota bacterium]